MSTIRISSRTAKELCDLLGSVELPPKWSVVAINAMAEMGRGIEFNVRKAVRKREKSRPTRAPKSSRARTKKEARASVREAVMNRAGLVCECGCRRWFRGVFGRATLDHFFGSARSESVATCWALREDCHLRKTLNNPDAAEWFRKFIAHCDKHVGDPEVDYGDAAREAYKRLAFITTRNGLPAAPSTGGAP